MEVQKQIIGALRRERARLNIKWGRCAMTISTQNSALADLINEHNKAICHMAGISALYVHSDANAEIGKGYTYYPIKCWETDCA